MQSFKCYIGIHKYEVLDTIDVKTVGSSVIRTIILRCAHCGKISYINIDTNHNYG